MRRSIMTIVACAVAVLVAPAPVASAGDKWEAQKRGEEWMQKRDVDRAIAAFGEAIRLDPNYDSAYQSRAFAYLAKKDYDRAIADFTSLITLSIKSRDQAAAKYRQLFGHESHMVGADTVLAHYYAFRGGAWAAKRDLVRAIADYDEAIKLAPNEVSHYKARGDAWWAKGDLVRAIADYDGAVKLAPKEASYYQGRCILRALANRDLTLALADCNESLRLVPTNNVGSLAGRGFVYLRLGRLDDAIVDYDAALKIFPNLSQALYGRGLAKLGKRDLTGGNADIAAAKALQANIVEDFAKYGLGPS